MCVHICEDVEEEIKKKFLILLRRNSPEFNMRDLEIQEAVQSSMKHRISKKVSENTYLKTLHILE